MRTKFVTMGEIMLRMTRPDYQRLTQGRRFNDYFGGSEANVAVSLAMQGDDVEYITRLPNNQLGITCRNELRKYSVDTNHIVWGGSRLGLYYFEQAVALRGSSIVYDREDSAMMGMQPRMVDWKNALSDAQEFHWSGISCALSKNASDATLEGLAEALRMGIYTSIDINYRKNLWNYGVDAHSILFPAAKRCHIIFGDTGEWQLLTGNAVPPFNATDTSFHIDLDAYRRFFDNAQKLFPKTRHFIMAMRNQLSATHHLLTGLLYADGNLYHTRIMDIDDVLDPMGVGDAFIAAYLHAHFKWKGEHQMQLDYALTASAMKNTVLGDFNLITEEDILECMNV